MSKVRQLENTPLAERAREAILDAILSDRFPDNRLPAEDELGKLLNVSRTTVRTALHSLEREGIITRRRAVGTTINTHVGPSMLALQRLIGFDRLLEEKGHTVRVDSTWERQPPPKDMAAIFGVDSDQDCFLTEKLYHADEEPAIYVRDLVPWSNLERAPGRRIPPSLFEFSKTHCRRPIDHAVVDLVPMIVTGSGTTRLELDGGEPFTRLHENHHASDGEVLAFSVIDVDDRFIRFQVFRRQ